MTQEQRDLMTREDFPEISYSSREAANRPVNAMERLKMLDRADTRYAGDHYGTLAGRV